MAWPHLEKTIIQHHKTVSDMEPARRKKRGTATEHPAPRSGCRSQADRNGMGAACDGSTEQTTVEGSSRWPMLQEGATGLRRRRKRECLKSA